VNLIKEPLFHFLLLGALLFGLYFLITDQQPGENHNQIVITAEDIGQIKALFAKQWQRPPTDQELQGLIDSHVREQVFYREALALGLDKGDTIVRRRLAQKMEFIIADVSLPKVPAEPALRGYYDKHPDRYQAPARITFVHIYLNPDQRGGQTEAEANAMLDALRESSAGAEQHASLGDRFMLEYEFTDRSVDEIERNFGQEFADNIVKLTSNQWHGPVESGYGIHLVYLSEIVPAARRSFDQVRKQVQTDYLFDLRREANDKVYAKLRERYEIMVNL